LLIVAVFVCSWVASRSEVFSLTAALCAAFGTHLSYVYVNATIIIHCLLLIYLAINLASLVRLLTADGPARAAKAVFVVSLVCAALCWEMWLDYAVCLLVGSAYLFAWSRRHPGRLAGGNLCFVAVGALVLTVAYLAVRTQHAEEFHRPGMEAEMVTTYSHVAMMVEDVVANVFTYLYVALTTYVPSPLVASNSLVYHGESALIEQQHGYAEDYAHLVPMHHLFLWRFYAGVVSACFAWFAWKNLRRSWREPSTTHLVVSCLCLMVLFGFATHGLIKFRPYLSVPTWSYKCIVSIVGVTLLLCYLLMIARGKFATRRAYFALLAVVYAVVISAAASRPGMHVALHEQVGCPGPADPLVTIRGWFGD
jgi:hypothetical protein